MADWNRILVAVDDTPTSEKALRYLGEISGCTRGLTLCLLHVYPEPPPYFYREGHSLGEYRAAKEQAAAAVFGRATGLLAEYGIRAENIATRQEMTGAGKTISEVILQVQAEGGYGTVVVGKRGVSKAEEFLFGSISNTVVRKCSGFTVWVVG